jgi:hypothetical protein
MFSQKTLALFEGILDGMCSCGFETNGPLVFLDFDQKHQSKEIILSAHKRTSPACNAVPIIQER